MALVGFVVAGFVRFGDSRMTARFVGAALVASAGPLLLT